MPEYDEPGQIEVMTGEPYCGCDEFYPQWSHIASEHWIFRATLGLNTNPILRWVGSMRLRLLKWRIGRRGRR